MTGSCDNNGKKAFFKEIVFVIALITVTIIIEFFICSKTAVRVYPDDIGFMAGVAKITGYSWDEAISFSKYYGPGYYIFYYVFFKFINNPLVLREIIIIGNAVLIGISAAVVYFLLRKLFYDSERWWICVLSFLGVFFGLRLETTLSNEYMNLFLFCLISYLIALYLLADNKKIKIFIFVLTLLSCVYSFSVHSRNVVFVVGIFLTVLSIFFLKKEISYKFLILIIIAIGLCVVVYKKLPDLFVKMIWSTKEQVDNTKVDATLMISRVLTIDEFNLFVYTLIGNIFMTVKKSFGMVLIGGYYIISDIFKYRKIRMKDRKKVAIDGVCLFSFFCYFIGMIAVSMQWRGNPKGTGYWRYYGIYAIVFCLVGTARWFKEKKHSGLVNWSIFSLTILLIKAYLGLVWPIQSPSKYYYYGFIDWMKKFENPGMFFLCLAFTFSFIILSVILLTSRFKIAWIIVVILYVIVPNFSDISVQKVYYPNIVEKISDIADDYRDDESLVWGYYGPSPNYLYIQYIFMKNKVSYEPEFDDNRNTVYFSNDLFAFPEEIDLSDIIELDDNEFMYTTNEKILADYTVIEKKIK